MKRNEDDVERVRPVQPWVMAMESLLLCAVVPILGRWLNAADPFFVHSKVSWPLLAPMLAGLRHGFMAGFGSAAALSFALLWSWRTQTLPVPGTEPPAQLIAALLLTGMLAGQFAHLWATQARRIAGLYSHQRQRFEEFARNYQLLKVSHDGLEERSAAARGNLRTAISTLRSELLRAPGAESALQSRAPFVLEVFQSFGHVQAAALLPVSGGKAEAACATLGRVSDRVAIDPLVTVAIKSRRVASLAQMGRDGNAEAAGDVRSNLAAAVPLVDVDGRVWAVLAIQELPFYAFTQENLSLFALMAGALADTLEFGATVKSYDPKSTQRFEQRVRRCLVDARRHGVPASLVVFSVSNAARAGELLPRVLEERRGIDEACLALAPDGGLRLFVLLPLTDGRGAEAYLKRLDKAVQNKLRVSLNERGVRLIQSVDLQDSASDSALAQLKLLSKPKATRAMA
jgi:hypothetical protein